MRYFILLVLLISLNSSAQLQWHPLNSALSNTNGQRFDDVFFISDAVGWAANGYYASVYKTIDGGITWKEQLSNKTLGANYYFRNIEFLTPLIGFVGTLNNVFFKTIDGGTTWTKVTNMPKNPVAICGLDAVGTSTVYGCGAYFSPAFIIKSIDSGSTWSYIDMSLYANALVEVLFLDENIGYVSGKNSSGAVILKTFDGGTTWTEIFNSGIPGEYVWKLQILSSNSDIVFGSIESVAPNFGKLIKSTNAGTNWISKNAPDVEIQAVGFITENHGWMGGHNSGLYETFDSGTTWNNINVGSNLNRIFVINENLAYASGTTIYKWEDIRLGTPDFQEMDRIPLAVIVYPNPVKDVLNVTIDFTNTDHLIIELYNLLGQRLKELKVDSIPNASKKTYSLDFPYPSGNYILNIHTNTGRQSLKFTK